MSIGNIIQLIIALPKIVGLIRDLLALFEKKQSDGKQEKIKEGLDEGQSAKSKEEKWKANEKVTSNLP